MENINQPPPDSGKSYIKFLVVLIVLIVLALTSYWAWEKFTTGQSGLEREIGGWTNYRKATSALDKLERALKNDTYGGKTPEETLRLFIDALKKGDLELASKYFALETNMNDPNYLTRKTWEDDLAQAEKEGRIEEIASRLGDAKPAGSSMPGYFGFEVRDKAGNLVGDIGMRLNDKSGVWKIESL